jgi:TolA-binding protein
MPQDVQHLLDAGRILFKLGEICYRKKEHTQAAGYWRKVLEIEPENSAARSMLERVETELARRD